MTVVVGSTTQMAPPSASAPRQGAPIELIVFHNSLAAPGQALAAYTAPDATSAPHYYIDHTGAVTRLVADERAARHSGATSWRKRRRNIDRISIGVVLAREPFAGMSDAQLSAARALVEELRARHGLEADALAVWGSDVDVPLRGGSMLRPAALPQPGAPTSALLQAGGGAREEPAAPAPGQPDTPPQPLPAGGPFPVAGTAMVSTWVDYPRAPETVRTLINQALKLVGNDGDVVPKALSDEQRRTIAPGINIGCADAVSFSLRAGGLDLRWSVVDPTKSGRTGPRAANYYRTGPGNADKLRDVTDEPPLPGDVFIHFNSDLTADRVGHVNLYVGPFSGTDHSGNVHKPAAALEVVEGDIGSQFNKPRSLKYCLTIKSGYKFVRRVRLLELERKYREAGMLG